MVMRGEIHWVDLGDPVGSEPGQRRPALVVQTDAANRAASTTVVAVISSRLPSKAYPMHVRLPDGLLPKVSIVKCEQLVTVDIDKRIPSAGDGPVATLDAHTMREVDRALANILNLAT